MDELQNSIEYANGELSFIIPADYPTPSDWIIWTPGHMTFDDGFSMSWHFYEGEAISEAKGWEAGKRYVITDDSATSISSFDDLTMFAYLPDGNGGEIELKIDFMPYILPEIYPKNYVIVKFPGVTGATWQLLLSQPVRRGDSGIWCVERCKDENGSLYPVLPDTGSGNPLLDYYTELQKQCDDGHKPSLLDPLQVAMECITNILSQSATFDELVPIYSAKTADFEKITETAVNLKPHKDLIDDFDGDNLTDEVIFDLGLITDDRSLVDEYADGVNIVNAYPKLTINFADGKTAVRRFNTEEYIFYRNGRFSVADFDGDGQCEIAVELQSMGSFPNNHIYILKYNKISNSFTELSTIRGYEFDKTCLNDYQYIISCQETGFTSEPNRYSDEAIIEYLYNKDGALKAPDNISGGVDGIEYFYTVQTEYGTGIEIHQYAWDASHSGNIGYAISLLVWKDGELALLSQRFAPYTAPVPVFAADNPSDFATAVTEDTPPAPAETQPARPVELEKAVYGFISWHHNYYIFMNNDELKPEVTTIYAIWQTYLLETAIGGTFEAGEKNFGWKIPAEAVKNAVSYLYGLDGNSEAIEYDDFYIFKDNPGYFRLPDGFSPDIVWAFIQWDTLTVDNGICKFDVTFYNSPTDDNDRGEELRTFNYQFEQVLYKDSSPSKVPCYRFIGAARVK